MTEHHALGDKNKRNQWYNKDLAERLRRELAEELRKGSEREQTHKSVLYIAVDSTARRPAELYRMENDNEPEPFEMDLPERLTAMAMHRGYIHCAVSTGPIGHADGGMLVRLEPEAPDRRQDLCLSTRGPIKAITSDGNNLYFATGNRVYQYNDRDAILVRERQKKIVDICVNDGVLFDLSEHKIRKTIDDAFIADAEGGFSMVWQAPVAPGFKLGNMLWVACSEEADGVLRVYEPPTYEGKKLCPGPAYGSILALSSKQGYLCGCLYASQGIDLLQLNLDLAWNRRHQFRTPIISMCGGQQ